jgi:outer membrane protein assembly factor BamB
LTAKAELASVSAEWRWMASLARQERWRQTFGKPAGLVVPTEDGAMLVQGGDFISLVGRDGKQRWRCGLGTADEMSDASRNSPAHQPLPLGDKRYALGLPGCGAGVVDGQGTLASLWKTREVVRGRPVLYTSELGGGPRLSVAAEVLLFGPLGGKQESIKLPAPAIAGPVVISKDVDRLLVVATVRGHLLAFEESTQKLAWDHDTRNVQLGQMHPIGDDQVVMLINDNQLMCCQLTPTGMQPRWNHALGATATGEPVVVGRSILVAVGKSVRQFGTDGIIGKTLVLPEVASTAPAVSGEVMAVGCGKNSLAVFRRGEPAWITLCHAAPVSVACMAEQIVVGLDDGTVVAYAP